MQFKDKCWGDSAPGSWGKLRRDGSEKTQDPWGSLCLRCFPLTSEGVGWVGLEFLTETLTLECRAEATFQRP